MEKYTILGQIGKGSFSRIYKSQNKDTGEFYAIKVVKKLEKYEKVLKREIEILKKLDHPNVIKLHEVVEHNKTRFLVLDYCGRGDLSTYVKKGKDNKGWFYNTGMSLATIQNITKQLASGLEYLRSKDIVHRDLKPANLLMDEHGVLKIADLGFAKTLALTDLSQTLCGSPLYMAPEILQKNPKYTPKADLWSVGVMLYQFLYATTPYSAKNMVDLHHSLKVFKGPDFGKSERAEEMIKQGLGDLITKLLKVNPDERITFEEFFSHWYIREPEPKQKLLLIDNYQPVPPKVKKTPINTAANSLVESGDGSFVNIPSEAVKITPDGFKKSRSSNLFDMIPGSKEWNSITSTLTKPKFNPFKTFVPRTISTTQSRVFSYIEDSEVSRVKFKEYNSIVQSQQGQVYYIFCDIERQARGINGYVYNKRSDPLILTSLVIVFCDSVNKRLKGINMKSIVDPVAEKKGMFVRDVYNKFIKIAKKRVNKIKKKRTEKTGETVYRLALDEAKSGAIAELVGSKKSARYSYKLSVACFELLEDIVTDDKDMKVLEYYKKLLDDRVKKLENM